MAELAVKEDDGSVDALPAADAPLPPPPPTFNNGDGMNDDRMDGAAMPMPDGVDDCCCAACDCAEVANGSGSDDCCCMGWKQIE